MRPVLPAIAAALTLALPAIAQEYIDTGTIITSDAVSVDSQGGDYVNIGTYPGTTLDLAPAPVYAAPETVPLATVPVVAPPAPVVVAPYQAPPAIMGTPDDAYNQDRLAAFDKNGDGRITSREAIEGLGPL